MRVPQSTYFNGWAMTMPYHITVGKEVQEQEQEQINFIIQTTFDEINQTVNNWNPQSEVSLFNRENAAVKHVPSIHFTYLLSLCDQINTLSKGKFDPTINPLSQVWKQALEAGAEPNSELLVNIQKSVGWNHIHFDEKSVWKEEAKTSLDFCALSKGYCVDLLLDRLQVAGFKDLFVEWAGEVRAVGKHPSGRQWTVQIEPMQENSTLINSAMATSGDYAQKEWRGGYFHIFDPLLGRPLIKKIGSISAVTVMAPTCALADALATALMVFETKEDAIKWSERVILEMPEVKVWIISRE
jgi:thiamine biosynthesis lipoprotein